VEITSDQLLVADNIKWASPPYDTVGAGFNCGPLLISQGKEFVFPFSSFSSWTNAYCAMANTSNETATVTLEVYDASGGLKKAVTRTIGGRMTARSWDWLAQVRHKKVFS
jgi:hypothetical protein